jgi:hypothetical protein
MTEKQKYRVLEQFKEFETREYQPVVLADVFVSSDRSSAGSKAFRPLFDYISTNKISMTAPVIQEEAANNEWRVSFVMPAETKMEDLPLPMKSPVLLRQLRNEKVAARRFSGGTDDSSVKKEEEKLRSEVVAHGFRVIGPIRVARFNAPWVPSLFRHNEVLIPIE